MYEAFYGLTEKPFALTPNPKFVFQSEQYRAAEQALLYGIAQKEGFMLVTGAPGTGKTTLCRDLLEKLDPATHRVALIFNPFFDGIEMLAALHSEFGLGDVATTSRKELLDRLNAWLLEQLAAGRTCIAIFDEAQHLSTGFLEQIRVLSNLETNQEKLIQIILVGQPELLGLIRTPQMAQLDQRVSVRCTLTHLSLDEASRYVYHRLNVAGARGSLRFDGAALRVMHAATGGVPRLINLACDRALLAAYAGQAKVVTLAHMKEAIASLRGEDGMNGGTVDAVPRVLSVPGRGSRARWWAIGVAAMLLVVGLAWWRFDGSADLLALRAAMSGSSRSAERAYLSIVQGHPRSRQRANALLRLAQLGIARGDARAAIAWLDQLFREYPASAENGERQYWSARALLANGDTSRSCEVTRTVPRSAVGAFGPEYDQMRASCDAFADRQRATATADSLAASGAVADTAGIRPAGTPARADSALPVAPQEPAP